MKQKQVTIGIDLGTTTSLVGCSLKGIPIIFSNERGYLSTPCIVAFRNRQTAWVGELARNLLKNRQRDYVVVYPKKLLGTEKQYQIGKREYSPSEIILIILRKLKTIAANYLKIKDNLIRKAILTVPAHFNDSQRLAVIKAGNLAGFNVVRPVSDPVAIAVAYEYSDKSNEERLLVFDLGGGTLDVALIEITDGCFFIRGLASTDLVGGINFDETLAKFLARKFEEISGIDFVSDPILYQNVLDVAEKTKIDLSFVEETEVLFPYLLPGNNTKKTYFNVTVNRSQFEKLTEPLFNQIRNTVMEVFRKSSIVPGWVSTLIIAGGASRIPKVEKILRDILPSKVNIKNHIHPEQAVAIGASILSELIDNPERLSQLEFRHVTSYHLGLEDNEGNMVIVIPKGSTYPYEITRTFTTAEDNAKEAIIRIVQSKDPNDHNTIKVLGNIILDRLPPAKAGEPNIQIRFSIDEYGALKVSVQHPLTKEDVETVIKTGEWKGKNMKPERRGTGLRVV